jgi:sulfatase modifying factor 1
MFRAAVLLSIVFLLLSSFVLGQETKIENSIGTKLRLLEGGRFIQGSDGGENRLQYAFPLSVNGQFFGNAETPAHVTWITRPFYLAEAEVTVSQFREFVNATKYVTSAERGQTEMVGWSPTSPDKPLYQSYDFAREDSFSWKNPGFKQDDNHPVVGVSWADAQAFVKWLSKKEGVTYRLPTEAEWEFACRAGTTTWFSFGDVARDIVHKHGNLGNVELEKHRKHSAERQWLLDWDNAPSDGHVFTAPIRSYQANPWGFHDMHGNVWEWCEDHYLDTIYKDYTRPKYNLPAKVAKNPVNTDRPQTTTNQFRTIRGGSWYNSDIICRAANRTYWDEEDAACYVGFRIAREGPKNVDAAEKNFARETAAIKTIESAGGTLYSSRGLDLEVRLEGNEINPQALDALPHLTDLRRLNVSWRSTQQKLTDEHLQSIAKLTHLESLQFSDCLDPNKVNLDILTQLKQLTTLGLPRTAAIQDRHLKQLERFSSLHSFTCYGTSGGLTDTGISYLKNNQDLEVLEIMETEATGSFLNDFVNCPLRKLAVTRPYSGVARLTDQHTQRLASFSSLESLNLTGQANLTGKTLTVISKLESLRHLTLDGCRAIEPAAYAGLALLQRLDELQLRDTIAGDVATAAIARIPRISRLKIHSPQLTDTSVGYISRAFSIRKLDIASDLITDNGLARLGRINRLDNLQIRSARISGIGLGPVCRLPNLRDLGLNSSGLTDVAFDFLAEAKGIHKIRLAHRGFQPASQLTNAGLMKMSHASWLRELWIPRNGTKITEDKITELQKLIPKSGVIPYTVTWQK